MRMASRSDPNLSQPTDGLLRKMMATEKEDRQKDYAALAEELDEQQRMLYAQDRYAVLLVFQALDAGGKDGTIRHVFDGVNPQGVKVAPFKVRDSRLPKAS